MKRFTFNLLVTYLFYNIANAGPIKNSLLEDVDITQKLKDQNDNEITPSNQNNSDNEIDSYSRNETLLNAETTHADKNPRNKTSDSAITSEYELVIEIFDDRNQTSYLNITTERPKEFVFTSQTKYKDVSTNTNVLQIVEVLFKNNQSRKEASTTFGSDDIYFEVNSEDDTSTESTAQNSTEQVINRTDILSDDEIFLRGWNALKPVSKRFHYTKNVIPKNNAEKSITAMASDHDMRSVYLPKQRTLEDIPKLPSITCNPHVASQKGDCVNRSNIINNNASEYTTMEKSSFSLPCPPGTGRAADNTCQSRA